MTQGVGHRDELRLVAELGEEDDPETDECGGEHVEEPFDASPTGQIASVRPTFGRRSRPPHPDTVRRPGFTPVCRHDDWGLLPFADEINDNH